MWIIEGTLAGVRSGRRKVCRSAGRGHGGDDDSCCAGVALAWEYWLEPFEGKVVLILGTLGMEPCPGIGIGIGVDVAATVALDLLVLPLLPVDTFFVLVVVSVFITVVRCAISAGTCVVGDV